MNKLLAAALLIAVVGSVSAAPVSVPENVAVGAEMATASDTQIFINKTSRKLVISVGDFFPTDYTLKPGATEYVYVSSNNQTVKIKDAK